MGQFPPRDKKGRKNQLPSKDEPKTPTARSAQRRRNAKMIPMIINTLRPEPVAVRGTQPLPQPASANRQPATKKSVGLQATSLENCINSKGMDKMSPTRPRTIGILFGTAIL